MDLSSDARGVVICANPFSGAGPNRRYVDGLSRALVSCGLEPRLIWDLNERRNALNDPGLTKHNRCVVVAGGDGSIQAVVNELAAAGRLDASNHEARVGFATLPMGNENLFAKHFGFTRDPRRLADAIEAGQTHGVDIGRITRTADASASLLFTLMVGVGFDAEVVHRVDHWRTGGGNPGGGLRRVRRISYVPKIASTWWNYRYPPIRIEVDGQSFTGAHLFVFNLPRYGGGLKLAPPECKPDDGLLDWVLFEKPGKAALMTTTLRVLTGRSFGKPGVHHGQAKQLTIHTPDPSSDPGPAGPLPVQVDGDPAGHAPIEVGVDPGRRLELLKT